MEEVEFKDLYAEPEVHGCIGCIFCDGVYNCGGVMQDLTGISCSEEDIIFKRKPKYIECKKENTQVSDEVWFEDRRYRVDLIYDNDDVVLTYIGNYSIHSICKIGDCFREVSSVYK